MSNKPLDSRARLAVESAPMEKNAAAVALGQMRWAGRTEAEKLAHARMMVKARLKPARRRKARKAGAAK